VEEDVAPLISPSPRSAAGTNTSAAASLSSSKRAMAASSTSMGSFKRLVLMLVVLLGAVMVAVLVRSKNLSNIAEAGSDTSAKNLDRGRDDDDAAPIGGEANANDNKPPSVTPDIAATSPPPPQVPATAPVPAALPSAIPKPAAMAVGSAGGGGVLEGVKDQFEKAKTALFEMLKIDYGPEAFETLFIENVRVPDEGGEPDKFVTKNVTRGRTYVIPGGEGRDRLKRKVTIKVLQSLEAREKNSHDRRNVRGLQGQKGGDIGDDSSWMVPFRWMTGGHSAAASHGNLFNQSYTAYMSRALTDVFAATGIRFEGFNYAMVRACIEDNNARLVSFTLPFVCLIRASELTPTSIFRTFLISLYRIIKKGSHGCGPELAICMKQVYGRNFDVLRWVEISLGF